MEKGYIGLYRKIRDWEWYTDINTKVLFIHLILSVNHCDKNWRGQLIKRGQFISSFENLASATGLTVQEVRTALDKLILTKDIIKVSTNKHSTITVTNYNLYQDFGSVNSKQVTNKQQTNNKQSTTTKELKELEKLKERELSHFDFLIQLKETEINLIKKKYRLSEDQWKFCINKYNDQVLKKPTIINFETYVSNWKDNLKQNDNEKDIIDRPGLRRIGVAI